MPKKKSAEQKNKHPKEGASSVKSSVNKNSQKEKAAQNKTARQKKRDKRKAIRAASAAKRKKRRWKVIFIWFLIIVAGLFVLLNGPLTRHFGQHYLDQALKDHKIDGQAIVDGTLLQGLSLRQISFKNIGQIKQLTAAEIKLHYTLGDLLKKRIHSIESKGLSLLIETESEKEKEPFTFEKIRLSPEIPRLINEHLTPIGLDLRRTNLTLTKKGKPLWQGQNLRLTHLPGHRHLTINYSSITDIDGHNFSPPKSLLYFTEKSLALESLPLTRELTTSALIQLDPSKHKNAPFYSIDLRHQPGNADTLIQLQTTDFKSLTASLTGTPLDSATLPNFIPLPDGLRFVISELNANIPELTTDPKSWLGEAEIKLARYTDKRRDYALPFHLKVNRTEADQYQLTAALPPSQHKEKNLPFSQKTNINAQLTTLDGWGNGVCNLQGEGQSARWLLDTLKIKAPKGLKKSPTVWPNSSYSINGIFYWENKQLINITGEARFPELKYKNADKGTPILLTYIWENDTKRKKASTISANLHPLDELRSPDNQLLAFKGHFDPNANRAGMALVTDLKQDDLNTLQPLLNSHGLEKTPLSLLKAQWSATSQMKAADGKSKRNQGKLKITNALLTQPKTTDKTEIPPTRITGELSYDHERTIVFDSLHLFQKDLHFYAEGGLKDDVLGLTRLNLDKKRPDGSDFNLLKAAARLPINFKAKSLEDFAAQKGELNAYLETNQLNITDLQSLFQRPLNIKGTLNTNLTLRGSLKTPLTKGNISLENFTIIDKPDIPPTNIKLDLDTNSKKHLTLSGTAKAKNYPPLILSAALPLKPWEWVQNPSSFSDTPFGLQATAQEFPLDIVTEKVDAFQRFDATTSLNLNLSGSINQPKINGLARIDLKKLTFKDNPIPPIQDVPLKLSFNETLITIDPVTLNLLGGQYRASGNIDIAKLLNPTLNLDLSADTALLWRNESFTSRANARLKIAGPLDEAALTGNLDIIESLYYREIEILPIGTATKTKEPPKLPGFSKANQSNTFPVPAPFSNWNLDINVNTPDPILVRGNLATADIQGKIHFTGKLSQPITKGALEIKKAEATLPFSRLKVAKGKIRFTGKNLLNPIIELRGNSRINAHDITFNLSGPLNSSKTLLSSNPPLPEHDILALLATGVTTSGLEDQETASTKALQYLLERLRQNPPGGPDTALAEFLTNTRDVQLSVGEKSPFTGRQFSSATVPLHERWFISAAVDEDRRTRGLLLYVLRFH